MRFTYGQTALHLALEQNQLGIAQLLLEGGSSISVANRFGQLAIHSAVLSGSTDAVDLVLLQGASLEDSDDHGATALHTAFSLNAPHEMISYLIAQGSNVNATNIYNNSPLIMSAIWNLNSETAKKLLAAGANIDAANESGNTALYEALERNNKELALYLLAEAKASYILLNNEGKSALSIVLLNGSTTLDWFGPYLETNQPGHNGNLPLHVAAIVNAPLESVDYLLNKGSQINAQNGLGQSALHLALVNQHSEMASNLVARGASLFTQDHQGKEAILVLLEADLSTINNIFDPMPILPSDKEANTVLHYAVMANRVDVVKHFINSRPEELQHTNRLGQSALHLAAYRNSEPMVTALIDAGVPVNLIDNRGDAALDLAIRVHSNKAGIILINNGANLNSNNGEGKSPVFVALESDNYEIFKLIIDSPTINLSLTNLQGNTILHEAVLQRNSVIVKYIIAKNADTMLINRDGLTAKELATLLDYADIVKIFK